MWVPEFFTPQFFTDFEEQMAHFLVEEGLILSRQELRSKRFLGRSVVPHLKKLSSFFNRIEGEVGLDRYWKTGSNPAHLRLAYFLQFMPANLFRVAAIWAELRGLGFQWKISGSSFSAIELGAGPASGVCGISLGEKVSPLGLPSRGHFALIEQNKAVLELGSRWAGRLFSLNHQNDWTTRNFHRKVDFSQNLLSPFAPKFHLWIMSFFLNEIQLDPKKIAESLIQSWTKHLEDEGLVILVEPALKMESRKILEIRKHLLSEIDRKQIDWLQVLLPCLGHQECGALKNPEDWCHEEVSWWRPPYLKILDTLTGLDHKTLPFSYLVIARSKRPRSSLLPGLKESVPQQVCRLVSPARKLGQDLEFFYCGQDGKCRARLRKTLLKNDQSLGRGSVLLDVQSVGDSHSVRIQGLKVFSPKHSKK